MNTVTVKDDANIADVLKRVEDEITSAKKAEPINGKGNGSALSAVGEENAKRLRAAADKVAGAVEDQASERLAVAMSVVEEAKALQAKAEKIAADVRAAGEVEAKRSIEVTNLMDETVLMMEKFPKFEASQP